MIRHLVRQNIEIVDFYIIAHEYIIRKTLRFFIETGPRGSNAEFRYKISHTNIFQFL